MGNIIAGLFFIDSQCTIGVPYCYWSTSRVLHCSDASRAHTLVIFLQCRV